MPKFYGQNKKRIDPRYFLEETTNRDGPPWGPEQPGDNIRSFDPAARVQDVATAAMTDQIRNLSDEELQAAWDRLDPFGMNPEKQKRDGRAISNEMVRRFREHFRKMTPEGGWSLDRGLHPDSLSPDTDNDGIRDDKEQAIKDILDDEGTEWTEEDEERARENESEEDKYHRERHEAHKKRWR